MDRKSEIVQTDMIRICVLLGCLQRLVQAGFVCHNQLGPGYYGYSTMDPYSQNPYGYFQGSGMGFFQRSGFGFQLIDWNMLGSIWICVSRNFIAAIHPILYIMLRVPADALYSIYVFMLCHSALATFLVGSAVFYLVSSGILLYFVRAFILWPLCHFPLMFKKSLGLCRFVVSTIWREGIDSVLILVTAGYLHFVKHFKAMKIQMGTKPVSECIRVVRRPNQCKSSESVSYKDQITEEESIGFEEDQISEQSKLSPMVGSVYMHQPPRSAPRA